MERIYWFTPLLILLGILLMLLANYRNQMIGYRTPRSVKSNRNWKFANRLSGVLCVFFGVIWSLVQILLSRFTDYSLYGTKGAILMICGFATVLFIVEVKLKKLDRLD